MKKSVLPYVLILLIISGCRAETEDIVTLGSVAELLPGEIGGIQQWLLIRGENTQNPVLLWLHGGPGSAQMPIHHAYTKELEKEYIVVHWDQRGAGKSNPCGFREETMTLDRFIKDTHEVTQYLKSRFHQDKIYLLGHSWGTTLGILVVDLYPGDYYAFISVSQVVHPERADTIAYDWLRQEISEGGSQKDKRTFAELGSPPFREHDRFVRFISMIDEFGGGMDAGFAQLMWKSLGASEYTFTDFVKWFKGASRGSGPMWEETREINLFSSIDSLPIPVYFFTGEKDYNTPHELVKEYYNFLKAPQGKYLVSFKYSAHTPFIAEPEKFNWEVRQVKYQIERRIP